MATWVIGDVQGCAGAFDALLRMLDPNPDRDRIWLAGDLVNRGPDSLGVLRRARRLGAECVLGNHDLHLLAVAFGARSGNARDTLQPVLEAPDREPLLDWLRRRPLLHHDPEIDWTMVHAGLPPEWDLATARRRAAEVEAVLAGDRAPAFLNRMYGDEASEEEGEEKEEGAAQDDGWGRLRYTLNALTRIRCVTGDGRLDLSFSGAPETRPDGLVPWFSAPGRRSRGERLVFGHWAALELDPELAAREKVRHVDTGCVWGGRLTALELQSGEVRSVDCRSSTRNS